MRDYHFITNWRVLGTVEEVVRIIGDSASLPRWWPSVYLDVQELEPGNEHGIGKVISLYTKGWLPYTLRWQLRVTEILENGFVLEACGDFVGRGIWTFKATGDLVDVTYDWKVRAEKPFLRFLSPILWPIFAANHRWAMAKGEESLQIELLRRGPKTEAQHAPIPPPPQATTTSPVPLLFGAIAVLAVGYVLVRRLS